jgi:hypothetical protein
MGVMEVLLLMALGAGIWMGIRQFREGREWGRLLVAGCALAAVAVAVIRLVPDHASPEAMGGRVDGFAYAAGVGMGRHLASTFPDARVRMVLRSGGRSGLPSGPVADGLEAELEGKVGSLERVQVVRKPKKGAESNPDEPARISMSDLREAFAAGVGEVDLIVFLFMPPDPLLLAWERNRAEMPALAVVCDDLSGLIDSIGEGVITAALARRPHAPIYQGGRLIQPPSNPMKAFSLCFEVITPENLAAFTSRYPHLVP